MKTQKMRNIFLLLASTLTIMAGATLAPALPGMKNAFIQEKNVDLWVKLILTISGLFIAVSSPFIGWLIDRWHKKKILIISLIIYGAFGTLGYFLNQSLQIILLGRIFLGVAVGGIMVAGTTLAGEYFKGPEFGRFMGLQAAFGSFGGVVFMGLGGLLAEISWSAPFLIYLFAFLILPGIILALKEPSKNLKPQLENENKLEELKTPKKGLFTCYGIGFLEVLILYLVPLHFPFYAAEFGIHDGSQIGFAISGMFLLVALVSLNYRYLNGKMSFAKLQGLGFTLVGLGYLAIGSATSFWLVLLGMSLAAIGFGITRPNLIVWLFSFSPLQERGRVIGGVTTVFFLAQFLSPFITQPLVHYYGIGNLFLNGGVVCLLVGLWLVVYVGSSYIKRVWA